MKSSIRTTDTIQPAGVVISAKTLISSAYRRPSTRTALNSQNAGIRGWISPVSDAPARKAPDKTRVGRRRHIARGGNGRRRHGITEPVIIASMSLLTVW